MPKVFIIAEAGVNHNGDVRIARSMIDAAVSAEADAVKFQSFNPEKFISRFAPKAGYQKNATGRGLQLEMIRKYRLDADAHKQLIKHCKRRAILFLSSPFDLESIDMLNNLGVKIFKIPSGEIINLPYLRKIGSLKRRIILSTGMASLKEIKAALQILIKSGTRKKDITVLHCNTAYPTPLRNVNLLAMCTIRDRFRIDVGYSDHTLGIEVPIAAAALGASAIEKHFTLDRDMPGPDHRMSLEPDELKDMVRAIRNIEKAMGDGIKRPSPSELENRAIVRKSLVAARDIKKGEIFSDENIAIKRLGIGITPMHLKKVLGRKAKKDLKEDALIEL